MKRTSHIRLYCLAALSVLLATSASGLAQEPRRTDDPVVEGPFQPQAPVRTLSSTDTGQNAETIAGRAGERVTEDRLTANPLMRLNNRIANRVQSRIRNRIDRYYDPQANVTSPFVVAGEQTRRAGRR
ncbi:hypothetical protein J2Y58_003081 [Sphingomonas sp. BE138]|uniref:hypothetical protein n=1 Tax=Sphingomonas sp. BE138 TaxID=2817845 RepID=UPI0028549CB9|nr:hypothetical protein [Sphingomonas sp. BE138]MDR6789706.1 hypothetical protein [Sphingomonas sp. BE138]